MRLLFLCVCIMVGTVLGAVYQVNDAAIAPNSRVELPPGDTAVLNGMVFIDSGATLVINPGCLVWGKPGSALVVARHGKLVAAGTRQRPIIFTATADSMKKTPLTVEPPYSGLWGGIVILGNAKVNAAGTAMTYNAVSETDPRALYGGNNCSDSSGILRYVSIRYAGTNEYCKEKGEETPDELNDRYDLAGLTLAGVGNKTRIEYVEVFKSLDDGFRFIGGSVRCLYLVSAMPMGSCFDFSEGFNGSCQFLAAFLDKTRLPKHRQFEQGEPIRFEGSIEGAPPAIFVNVLTTTDNEQGPSVFLSRSATFHIYNAIFHSSLQIYDNYMECWPQFKSGNSKIAHCVFVDESQELPMIWGACANSDSLMWYLIDNNNDLYTPEKLPTPRFFNVAIGSQQLRTPLGSLDPRPRDSLAITNIYSLASLPLSYGFQSVDFRGAFDPFDSTLWIKDWTGLDHEGYLCKNSPPPLVRPSTSAPIAMAARRLQPAAVLAYETASRSVRYEVPQSGFVRIALFGLDGRCLAVPVNTTCAAGTHRFSIDKTSVGVRLIRMSTNHSVRTVLVAVK